jgi:hypothetical protein
MYHSLPVKVGLLSPAAADGIPDLFDRYRLIGGQTRLKYFSKFCNCTGKVMSHLIMNLLNSISNPPRKP